MDAQVEQALEATEIQTLTDDHVASLNDLQSHKEKELMEF